MNKSHPLVSILIPSYNHERFVTETLDSVLKDTYPNKEIIIIDDGSKDKSDYVITNWITTYNEDISVTYRCRPNKGVCSTLNELLALAGGKYVILIASDDLLINNSISERVEVLELSKDTLGLISDAVAIDETGVVIAGSVLKDVYHADIRDYEGMNLSKLIDYRFAVPGGAVLFKKSIYEIIGKYPEDLPYEDQFFFSRAMALGLLRFHQKCTSKYRIVNNSLSRNEKSRKRAAKAFYLSYWRNLHLYSGKNKFKLLKVICKNWLVYNLL